MRFAICAGHSNTEPGNMGGGLREADLMDGLGHIVALKLRALGHEVLEDGPKGENWPLERAAQLVKQVDLAIELHTNASASLSARGVEVVAATKHAQLARSLARAIAGVIGTVLRNDEGFYEAEKHRKDRGWNSQALFVRAGGLIVETFFQTNPSELAAFQAKTWLLAEAIAQVLHKEAEQRKVS